MKLLLCLLTLGANYASSKAKSEIVKVNKLSIDVLYESLCPDSMRFIIQHLYPTHLILGRYYDLTLVPFGKSLSTSNGFECQHGPEECKGNLIQSCALHYLSNQQDKQVQFVKCFMSMFYQSARNEGKPCIEQVGLNWEQIKQCTNSYLGRELQLKAENITDFYKPAFVPTIIYDRKFYQDAQDSSLRGFHDYVCTRISVTDPNLCSSVTLI